MTRARAMATRCCWPPESCAGKWSIRSPSPTSWQQFDGARPCLPARSVRRSPRRSPGRSVSAQVEELEHEPDVLAPERAERGRSPPGLMSSPATSIRARVGRLDPPDEVEQGRLARAAGPQHDDQFTRLDVQVDVPSACTAASPVPYVFSTPRSRTLPRRRAGAVASPTCAPLALLCALRTLLFGRTPKAYALGSRPNKRCATRERARRPLPCVQTASGASNGSPFTPTRVRSAAGHAGNHRRLDKDRGGVAPPSDRSSAPTTGRLRQRSSRSAAGARPDRRRHETAPGSASPGSNKDATPRTALVPHRRDRACRRSAHTPARPPAERPAFIGGGADPLATRSVDDFGATSWACHVGPAAGPPSAGTVRERPGRSCTIGERRSTTLWCTVCRQTIAVRLRRRPDGGPQHGQSGKPPVRPPDGPTGAALILLPRPKAPHLPGIAHRPSGEPAVVTADFTVPPSAETVAGTLARRRIPVHAAHAA